MFWSSNSFYFITAKTFLGQKLFNNYYKKKLVLKQIKKAVKMLNVKIYSYSIAQNHYHCLLFLDSYNKHEKFKQIVNGGSSFLFHKQYSEPKTAGKMWLDSKTLIINSQTSLLKVMGYIDGNLLKHGEVSNFKELYNNSFSSFKQHIDKYGKVLIENMINKVIYVEEDESGVINLKII